MCVSGFPTDLTFTRRPYDFLSCSSIELLKSGILRYVSFFSTTIMICVLKRTAVQSLYHQTFN